MGRGFDAVNKMGKGCVMLESGESGGNWEDWGCCGVPRQHGGDPLCSSPWPAPTQPSDQIL